MLRLVQFDHEQSNRAWSLAQALEVRHPQGGAGPESRRAGPRNALESLPARFRPIPDRRDPGPAVRTKDSAVLGVIYEVAVRSRRRDGDFPPEIRQNSRMRRTYPSEEARPLLAERPQ